MPGASYALATTPNAASALAVVSLESPDERRLDEALASITGSRAEPGAVALRDLAGVDTGLVMRWGAARADLTPHGGPAVIRALTAALEERGIPKARRATRPEARSEIESRWLDAIARCPSPRGLDLLLRQPDLRARWPEAEPLDRDAERNRRLSRLLDPPLVAVVGPTNIGKSTLLNALAGRTLAVAADAPGVTRDAVGALVEIDGLVVRWLDTPGRLDGEARAVDATAAQAAVGLVAGADLVLSASDAVNEPVAVEAGTVVPVGLRSDLGAAQGARLSVSALDRASLEAFASGLRRLLVPDSDLESTQPWAFDA